MLTTTCFGHCWLHSGHKMHKKENYTVYVFLVKVHILNFERDLVVSFIHIELIVPLIRRVQKLNWYIQDAAEITPTFGGVTAQTVEGVQWWKWSRWLAAVLPFLDDAMGWSGEHRGFVVETFFSRTMNLWSRHKEHSVGTSDLVEVLPFQIEKRSCCGFRTCELLGQH